jgi:threonine/homoserine/homoserine lactone efflux protein
VRTDLLVNGIIYGLGAAIPIGPVNVEIGRRTLRRGFWTGVALGCGAVSVDVSYAVLYAVGVAQFTRHPAVYWPLAMAGVGLLAFLGIMNLRSARSAGRDELLEQAGPAASLHGSYLTGVLMTATNPMTIAFWFTVLPALAGRITDQPRRDLPLICIGVALGALSWVFSFSGLLSLAGRFRKPWWMTAADEVGGVMLIGLAAVALLRAVQVPL